MVRAPCCDKQGLKKGPWTPEEDKILVDYIQSHGHGIWRSLPKQAGLLRCGKSCRLRWINYLRPDIKRGPFTPEEQNSIVHLHGVVGNKWSIIAAQLPGRTDNEVKNYWNTHLKRRLLRQGTKPESRCLSPASSARSDGDCSGAFPAFSSVARDTEQWESARLEAEARLAGETLLPSHLHTAAGSMAEPDVFLRIWHSEVGEAFRSGDGATSTGASPASSSTMHAVSTPKQCRAAGPGAASVEAKEDGDCKSLVSGGGGGGNAEAAGFCVAGAHSPRSSERMYQMYLNWVGEDMALGGPYFQESFGSFSWLGGGDLGEETCLDTAFQ